MSALEIRPKFQQEYAVPPVTVLGQLEEALAQPTAPVKGYILDEHIYLKIPHEDQHFWSPQLHLEVEETEEGSRIKGVFGPRPTVWLLFISFYFFLAFASMVIMIMGFSQLNLGLSAKILWLLPVFGILWLLAYMSARAGQQMGHDQMNILYRFYKGTVEEG